MKRIILTLITAAVMLTAVIGLTSCGGSDEYDEFDAAGYTVSVKFDANGGQFKGTDSTVVDVFDPSAAKDGRIALLAPDDPKRDKNNTLSVTKHQHFLAGWYAERTPIDENDLTKGYTYSDRWDFANDRLEIDPTKEYTSRENALTLYAVWVPYYRFEIYAEGEGGFTLLDTVLGTELEIPEWEEGDVKLDMGDFPTRSGYTLDGVFADESCSSLLTDTLVGEWDEETGVSLTPTIKLYTKWLEGEIYRIYKPDDLRKNVKPGGYYEIMADLDFSDAVWPTALSSGKFSGRINGNGHTVSGISVTADGKKTAGVFGTLAAEAVIRDINFTDVTFVANFGIVGQGSSFGSFAGIILDGATVEGVSFEATVVLNEKILLGDYFKKDFSFGKLVGTGSSDGITATVEIVKENPEDALEFTVGEDGSITLSERVSD